MPGREHGQADEVEAAHERRRAGAHGHTAVAGRGRAALGKGLDEPAGEPCRGGGGPAQERQIGRDEHRQRAREHEQVEIPQNAESH